MNTFEEILNLMKSLGLTDIPDGTSKEMEFDGIKLSLAKDGDLLSIQLEANHEEDFDDTDIKELVAEYKENIKDLDDDVFIEVVDDMSEVLDIKELDSLLALDKYTKEEADRVEELIECSTEIVSEKLQNRIVRLIDLYNRF